MFSIIVTELSYDRTTITGNTPTGTVYGLYATSDASTNIQNYLPNYKIGVIGLNTSTADGSTYYGVYGQAKDAGVYGTSTDLYGKGVHGSTAGTYAVGVKGEASGQYGTGVSASTTGSVGYAVNAVDFYKSATSYAGYFVGKVHIEGTLSQDAGAFKIDHPLDPANKYLYHSFVESPDMMNIYNGIATLDEQGAATVEMPAWFDTLNSDFRYQLTSIGVSMPDLFIAEEIKTRSFKIGGGQPGQRVSWQVTGIRHDEWAKAHRIQVEEDKTAEEKGKYMHPELFGQPEEMSVHRRPVATK